MIHNKVQNNYTKSDEVSKVPDAQCVGIYDIVVNFDFEVSLWGICFRGRVIGVPHKLY